MQVIEVSNVYFVLVVWGASHLGQFKVVGPSSDANDNDMSPGLELETDTVCVYVTVLNYLPINTQPSVITLQTRMQTRTIINDCIDALVVEQNTFDTII